jgi:hypothetical protein
MKVKIKRVRVNGHGCGDIRADLTFSYDDRSGGIRSCLADIFFDKWRIECVSSERAEEPAVRHARNFLEETAAKCEVFSSFPAVTIEL